jgi:hypothetical protein
MAELERDLISRCNKRGFQGFPTLYTFPPTPLIAHPFEGITHNQLLITDLIGSSLTWFSKSKPLTIA